MVAPVKELSHHKFSERLTYGSHSLFGWTDEGAKSRMELKADKNDEIPKLEVKDY